MRTIVNENIHIRQATINDINKIAQIEITSQHNSIINDPIDKILNELFVREQAKRWRLKINNGVYTLILLANGKMIGFLSYSIHNKYNEKFAEINSIYIVPNQRRQLYGKLLCTAALQRINKMGINHVTTWIVNSRNHIKGFYEKLGFQNSFSVRVDKLSETVIVKEVLYTYLI